MLELLKILVGAASSAAMSFFLSYLLLSAFDIDTSLDDNTAILYNVLAFALIVHPFSNFMNSLWTPHIGGGVVLLIISVGLFVLSVSLYKDERTPDPFGIMNCSTYDLECTHRAVDQLRHMN